MMRAAQPLMAATSCSCTWASGFEISTTCKEDKSMEATPPQSHQSTYIGGTSWG